MISRAELSLTPIWNPTVHSTLVHFNERVPFVSNPRQGLMTKIRPTACCSNKVSLQHSQLFSIHCLGHSRGQQQIRGLEEEVQKGLQILKT